MLVVDIETTGLDRHKHAIIELGVVRVNLLERTIREVLNTTINEEKLITGTEWIFQHSDLRPQQVKEGIRWEDKTKKTGDTFRNLLQRIFDKEPATAYNAAFDFGFLLNRRIRIKECYCLMKKATNYCDLPHPLYGVKYPSVEEAYEILVGKPYKEKHRALDDAKHEAEIAIALFEEGLIDLA